MKTNFLLPVLIVVALLGGPGCDRKPAGGNPSQPTARKYSIAVIPKGTTHVFWQSVHAGALAAAKEFGCDISWNGPEREGDRERQIQIIEDFIVQKVDGIVVAPLDHKALVPSVEKLASRKIPCAIVDSGIATDQYVTFAATDNYQGGVLAARRLGKILDGQGNLLVLKYAQGSASTIDRENGFIETIQKEFPAFKIVDTKYGLDTVETALQAAEDLLTRNQNVQGFFACNESTTAGTLRALQSQKRHEIKLVGFDTSSALLAGLNAGAIDALVAQNPYQMGYEGVKAVVLHLQGQSVPKKIDTGVVLITKDSLADPKIRALLRLP